MAVKQNNEDMKTEHTNESELLDKIYELVEFKKTAIDQIKESSEQFILMSQEHERVKKINSELLEALKEAVNFLEQDVFMKIAADAGNKNTLFKAREAIAIATNAH